MKTSTQKRLGGTLVIASVLVGMVLFLAGAPLASVEQSTTHSGPHASSTVAVIRFHWPLVTMLASAVTGLFLLLKPRQ